MITLEQASRILGKNIVTQFDGSKIIQWETNRHDMTVFLGKRYGSNEFELVVCGTPKPWNFGSEVRKGRPRSIWVVNPSEKYLKKLKP